MEDSTIITLFAIAALVILEITAMIQGFNGNIYSTVIMVIAGLGGFSIAKKVYS